MHRKKWKALLAGLVAIPILITGCASSSTASKTSSNGVTASVLRIATQPSLVAAPLFVAKEKGWLESNLKKYNVSVKWSIFNAGPPMNESFAAGQQDIGMMGNVPAVIAKASGQKTRIISGTSNGGKTLGMIVGPKSTITSVKELKGKKVAYVVGSYGQYLLYLLLKNAGLTFSDIKAVNLANADVPAAVASGQVDAGIVWEPILTKAVSSGQGKLLVDATGIDRADCYFLAEDSFAKSNPTIVKAFIQTYEQAAAWTKAHPDEAAALVEPDVKVSKDLSVKIIPHFDYATAIGDANLQELNTVNQFLYELNVTSAKVNIGQFVDSSYLNSLKSSS